MKAKYVVTLTITAMILTIWLVLYLAQPQSPAPELGVNTNKSEPRQGDIAADITMKKEAYEPNEITIKAGQAVRFVNASSEKRWPASNIHPTHGIYPEFDPMQAIEPGESWTFTFHKPGSWRMHDHLLPYIKGTVVVE